MCDDRSWRLIAPWWAWPKLGAPQRDVRASAPVVQMYDTTDPVSLFVGEPQKALAYGADDQVHAVHALPVQKPSSRLSRFQLQPTGKRKLFLPTHKRFYLVVCELHCDAPGMPSVDREKVCEAGFVVRRRRLTFDAQHLPQAQALMAKAAGINSQLAKLDRSARRQVLQKRHMVTRGGVLGAMAGAATATKSKLGEALDTAAATKRAELLEQLAAVQTQLQQWKNAAGAASVAEGWIPSDAENVGEWRLVGDAPGATLEQVYPLYPLVPDSRDPRHDAAGKTLYFGMVPAVSREVDATGRARFDDRTRYEVRCFVRRHRCGCPKTGERNDCGGELVWSAPTAEFQLAAHFDPVGTGNHPITIQLPDIPALAASVGAPLPVRMVSPPGSGMAFQVEDGEPKVGRLCTDQQICFFSIPLITIVATFVLNLFLPIVVFVFQLWFLLGLKFCIPPSISFSAGAGLHADIQGKLALDADLDILLAADISLAGLGNAGLVSLDPAVLVPGSPAAHLRSEFDVPVLQSLHTATTADRTAEVEAISVVAGRSYVPRVERWEVGA